jgi:hypothetical protein
VSRKQRSVVAETDPYADVPTVCFVEDIFRLLKITPRTYYRHKQHGTFPIPMLDSLDRKDRFGRADVIRYLERRNQRVMLARRRA